MQIKKKKVVSGEKAHEASESPQMEAKEQKAMPMGVSAALNSLKKQSSMPSAKTEAMETEMPSAKTAAMDTGHSEAYKEKIKKRVK
jgi:hypothetical protein